MWVRSVFWVSVSPCTVYGARCVFLSLLCCINCCPLCYCHLSGVCREGVSACVRRVPTSLIVHSYVRNKSAAEHTPLSDRVDRHWHHWIMIWIMKYLFVTLCLHVFVCNLFCNLRMHPIGGFRGLLICHVKTQELQIYANLFMSSFEAVMRTLCNIRARSDIRPHVLQVTKWCTIFPFLGAVLDTIKSSALFLHFTVARQKY